MVNIFDLKFDCTRGPWTATPALIKVNIKNRPINKYFYQAKRYSKLGQFYGKTHCVYEHFTFLAQKAIFIPHLNTLKITRIEVKYTLCSAQGIKLSCEITFVKFHWLVLELPAAKQRVSNSVFFVSSYILVLRCNKNIVI